MQNDFVAIKVYEGKEKRKEKSWYIDISNMGLESLINLKKEIMDEGVNNYIDKLIYLKTCTPSFNNSHRRELRKYGKNKMKMRIKKCGKERMMKNQ